MRAVSHRTWKPQPEFGACDHLRLRRTPCTTKNKGSLADKCINSNLYLAMSFSFLVSLAYSGTAVICRGRVSNDHCTQRFCLAFSRCSIHIIVGAIIFCSLCIAGVTATEKEPCSETWFATNLVQARQFLAATSLPDQGLAMFAGGGQGLSFHSNLLLQRVVSSARLRVEESTC